MNLEGSAWKRATMAPCEIRTHPQHNITYPKAHIDFLLQNDLFPLTA